MSYIRQTAPLRFFNNNQESTMYVYDDGQMNFDDIYSADDYNLLELIGRVAYRQTQDIKFAVELVRTTAIRMNPKIVKYIRSPKEVLEAMEVE